MARKKTKPNNYDASTIEVLEGLDAIRKRPGMYIGNTDIMGLHHCVFEVVDNSVDEALQGHGSRIDVTIHPDQSVTVRDYARGIPVDIHERTGRPALEVIMTMMHAGGKFGGGGYKVSGGLHGIGVKAVNAVSEWMDVTVRRDGKIYHQRYERGLPIKDVAVVGKTKKGDTGTETTWRFDPQIFTSDEISYNFKTLAHRFRDMCFLTPGLQITLVDEREPGREATYYFQGGIAAFVSYLNRTRQRIHPVIYVRREVDEVLVEVAMQYTDGYQESIHTFANNINQPEGGTHLTGFRSALTRTINDYARRTGLLKEKESNFSGEDAREGLTAIVSVKVKDPQFEAQTKIKLNNPEVKGAVESTLNDALSTWLDENPREGKAIINKVLTASRARAAMKKARDMVIRKSALESMTLPGKLADCSERDPQKTELYIVEGDSAGGCFSGDTKVALADGRELTFEQLVAEQAEGKEHFVYTVDHDGVMRIAPAIHARLTKTNAQVVRVTLSNGEEIVCTPDHLFLLATGDYEKAESLTDTYVLDGVDFSLQPPRVVVGSVNVSHVRGSQVQSGFVDSGPHHHPGLYSVVSVEALEKRVDVYDLTVPETENFALASGVFVHNSAKQGRDRRFQAILPLRGKIINVEKARINKILDNREVQALISALGVGIGDTFELENLRYSRVVIMSVDGDEMTFVRDPRGQIHAVRVGPFIDRLWAAGSDPAEYEVLCFDPDSGQTRFKTIRSVIRHDHSGPIYEITTRYGRRIRVTGEHSVFVSDDEGRPVLRRGDEIRVGDVLAAPARLPLTGSVPERIDLLRSLLEGEEPIENELVVRGPGVEAWYRAAVREEYRDDPQMVEPRVTIPAAVGEKLAAQRQVAGLSQRDICDAVGIRQPVTYYAWEMGNSRPILSHFVAYAETLGLDSKALLGEVEVGDSRLDHIWNTQYRAAPANRVRDYVFLSDLSADDALLLDDDVTLSPQHHADQAVPRHVPVDEKLMTLLGFFVAEGSLSVRNGVRFAIGERNEPLLDALTAAIRETFGVEPTLYTREDRVAELRVLNRVVVSFFQTLFGSEPLDATRKHVPDLVFNVGPALQLAFLRGYYLGDGTATGTRISMTTVSETLADQLMYLLLAHGVSASLTRREPSGVASGTIAGKPVVTRHPSYHLTIIGREALERLAPVWADHPRAAEIRAWIGAPDARAGKPHTVPMVGDLVGLPVRAIREVEATGRKVYDFSVEGDETFICGSGGICAHNTDADVDGSHIRTLLLTFFFRYMQPLIEHGHLFIAQPPLYQLKAGKEEVYVYSEAEKEEKLAEWEGKNVTVQRYKGLGEMNPEQLWETTMNPEHRILLQATIEDAVQADKTFDMLMGAAVPPRKRFIQTHARQVRNLDI